MSAKRVLSLGQCSADHGALSMSLQRHFGAEVIRAESVTEALEVLRRESVDLVLVNRVFDADGSAGVEAIRQLKAEPTSHSLPIMLVSNYDDAQQEASEAGAVPGFGKGSLGHPAMLARLKPYLNAS